MSTARKKVKAKNVGGRPTVYDARFCKQVVAFMAQGFSLTAFAGTIGVSRETIYHWAGSIKEFGEALAVARAARCHYWETRLLTAEKDTKAVIYALRNACADEWKDKPSADVEVNINNSLRVDANIPPEEWGEAELRAELARRGAIPQKPAKGTKK